MIVTQAENLFDVHCDGCGECQSFSGIYNKSQLAKAIKADGWVYKYTEDPEKFRHFCRSCIIKNEECENKEIREKLIRNLEHMADPENGFFRYFVDKGESWRGVINQALDIIKKEKL